MPRTCVFCRAPASSREHVFPQWLSRYYHEREADGVFTLWSPEGRARKVRIVDATVRRVCEACNSGWLSRLETSSEPILRGLISGQETTLQPTEQRVLSLWGVKTCFMLQLYQHSTEKIAPLAHYIDLHRERQPQPGTRVSVGAYSGEHRGGHSMMGRPELRVQSDRGALLSWGYVLVLKIDRLVLKVFWIHNHRDVQIARRAEEHEVLSDIWPPNLSAVSWPPVFALTDDSYFAIMGIEIH